MLPLIMAAIGAMQGAAKRQGDVARENASRAARADAQAVSWAKQGQQFIPEIQQAHGSMFGNILGGGLAGGLQGQNLAQGGGMDWLKMGSPKPSNPYDAATNGSFLGMGGQYDPMAAKGYGAKMF